MFTHVADKHNTSEECIFDRVHRNGQEKERNSYHGHKRVTRVSNMIERSRFDLVDISIIGAVG